MPGSMVEHFLSTQKAWLMLSNRRKQNNNNKTPNLSFLQWEIKPNYHALWKNWKKKTSNLKWQYSSKKKENKGIKKKQTKNSSMKQPLKY